MVIPKTYIHNAKEKPVLIDKELNVLMKDYKPISASHSADAFPHPCSFSFQYSFEMLPLN